MATGGTKTRLWPPRSWVVCKDGRIGCVFRSKRTGRRWRTLIQFGADGPFHWHNASSLRKATLDEIDEVMGARRPKKEKESG